MDKNHKITIPKPCHEDWDKMNPKDNGRFCLSCTKTVIDFTQMLPEEVQHYFISNQDKSICGRFKSEQLDEVIIQIPSRVLYSQTQYHKMFLLALFIAMGTTLFSCADKNGDKQKIDKVKIVEDKPDTSIMLGMIVAPVDHKIKYNAIDYDTIFSPASLDIIPGPENGMNKFYDFVNNNYVIPNKAEKYTARIYLSFVVEKDGSLSTFKVLHDAGYGTGEEAIRVLKMSPKWIPGKLNNRFVRTSFNLPITIKNE
jgi:hypothetical protein